MFVAAEKVQRVVAPLELYEPCVVLRASEHELVVLFRVVVVEVVDVNVGARPVLERLVAVFLGPSTALPECTFGRTRFALVLQHPGTVWNPNFAHVTYREPVGL